MEKNSTAVNALLSEKFRTRVSPFIRKHILTLDAENARTLLMQFDPDARELENPAGFSDDPLSEEDADIHPFPDVIHKYRSKILYLTTDECPVYCRYCTRKRKTLLSEGHRVSPLENIADYLGKNPEINEVIFSGGDPLMLPVHDLAHRAEFFLRQPTVEFLRFHTRAFTTAPALVSGKFLDAMQRLRHAHPEKHLAFVLHINTAGELSSDASEKIQAIRALEIPLYSQTVLLRGINDDPQILARLLRKVTTAGVQPYYLHQLDRVTGSAHFEVSDAEGRRIYNELKPLIPAYMLPRFVRDSKQGKYPV